MSFSALALSPEVQRSVIPLALAGRDLVAMAGTGSGKTAAILLGRMAGMGKSGEALSLVAPQDGAPLRGIELALQARLEREQVAGFAPAANQTTRQARPLPTTAAARAKGGNRKCRQR